MYYSKGGREIFLKNFNKHESPVHEAINDMLKYQDGKLNKFKPEYLMRKLYAVNKELFKMDMPITNLETPIFRTGGDPMFGIKNLLEYVYKKNFSLVYGLPIKNKPRQFTLHTIPPLNTNCVNAFSGSVVKDSKYFVKSIKTERPELVIIVVDTRRDRRAKVLKGLIKDDLKTVFNTDKSTCIIDGIEYVQDSMILSNYNNIRSGHAIAGITCEGKRYIYNGWTINTQDRGILDQMQNTKPCDLFSLDWLTHKDSFCINPQKCDLPRVLDKQTEKEILCFNPKQGSIEYLMIRKDIYDSISKSVKSTKPVKTSPAKPIKKSPTKPIKKSPTKPVKTCPDWKVINPKTGRCIKDNKISEPKKTKTCPSSEKKPKKDIKISEPKTCPDGKVVNPKTGRCIKDIKTNQDTKTCPDGKVVNPKTGRCIKDVKTKECPDGKVLNPKTGRCIKN
jgi:hypothetical protein